MPEIIFIFTVQDLQRFTRLNLVFFYLNVGKAALIHLLSTSLLRMNCISLICCITCSGDVFVKKQCSTKLHFFELYVSIDISPFQHRKSNRKSR